MDVQYLLSLVAMAYCQLDFYDYDDYISEDYVYDETNFLLDPYAVTSVYARRFPDTIFCDTETMITNLAGVIIDYKSKAHKKKQCTYSVIAETGSHLVLEFHLLNVGL